MAKSKNVLEIAFEDDSLTNEEIFTALSEQFHLSYDQVQRQRAAHRKLVGLPPLKRGPRPIDPRPNETVGEFAHRISQPSPLPPVVAGPTVIIHKLDPEQFSILIATLTAGCGE